MLRSYRVGRQARRTAAESKNGQTSGSSSRSLNEQLCDIKRMTPNSTERKYVRARSLGNSGAGANFHRERVDRTTNLCSLIER
jgi:hypothetical protein